MVSNDSGFASLNITNSSATPASGSPFNAGTDPRSCALSQDGAYLFGGEAGATGTAVFSINPGTGVLTAIPGSPFATGNFVKAAYATDGFGRLLLADFFGGTLSLFTTSSGAPTAVSGNPFTSVLTNAIHGVVHPSGYYMVADRIGNRVGVYRISGSGSATSLAAVSGSPFAAGGSFTDILALNYDGAYLFAANGDTRNLTTFSVNAGTGALLSLGTQITDTLGATGRITGLSYAKPLQPPVRNGSGFVYTLKDVGTGNEIFGYSVNETTGALTALPGFPLGTGGNGTGSDAFQRIAYDPANARLYALNDGSNTISAYSVNRTMGAIAPLPFSPMSLGDRLWYCVSVAPNGSTLLAGELLSGTIASFSITSSSATQAAGSPYNSNSQAASCAFSQDGAYFYAGGNPANFAGFSVNGTTSVLTALSGSPFNSGGTVPIGFASDNAGRLFMTNAVSNTVRVFTTLGGVPSPVLGNPFTSGLTFGIYGILHPGGYYMVSDRGGNRVGVYRIQGSGPSTTLTAVSGSPFGSGGTFTQGLALNRAGTFLLAANGNSRNVTTYAVDAATGALNAANVQPPNTSGSTGTLTGMAYVPGLFGVYVPLILK
jgi:6-phosphogluconolactonase (cycloisomerase 2 family)